LNIISEVVSPVAYKVALTADYGYFNRWPMTHSALAYILLLQQ